MTAIIFSKILRLDDHARACIGCSHVGLVSTGEKVYGDFHSDPRGSVFFAKWAEGGLRAPWLYFVAEDTARIRRRSRKSPKENQRQPSQRTARAKRKSRSTKKKSKKIGGRGGIRTPATR